MIWNTRRWQPVLLRSAILVLAVFCARDPLTASIRNGLSVAWKLRCTDLIFVEYETSERIGTTAGGQQHCRSHVRLPNIQRTNASKARTHYSVKFLCRETHHSSILTRGQPTVPT